MAILLHGRKHSATRFGTQKSSICRLRIAHPQIKTTSVICKVFASALVYSSSFTNPRQFSASTFFTGANALNVCIIAGSTRTEPPPRPILCDRVTEYIASSLSSRANHNVTTIKVKDVDLPLLQKPHFSYAKSQIPESLSRLHETLNDAHAYVMITPEYNHAPCPGLMNLLNHFGSSTFSFKPSAIVSYSAGQWGGTRAAHSLRPLLSELGCLPVSAMVHIPRAGDILDANGNLVTSEGKDTEERWSGYVERTLSQMEWWANAAKNQRHISDPFGSSPAFVRRPSERDAP